MAKFWFSPCRMLKKSCKPEFRRPRMEKSRREWKMKMSGLIPRLSWRPGVSEPAHFQKKKSTKNASLQMARNGKGWKREMKWTIRKKGNMLKNIFLNPFYSDFLKLEAPNSKLPKHQGCKNSGFNRELL